jgi:hypothetical protein
VIGRISIKEKLCYLGETVAADAARAARDPDATADECCPGCAQRNGLWFRVRYVHSWSIVPGEAEVAKVEWIACAHCGWTWAAEGYEEEPEKHLAEVADSRLRGIGRARGASQAQRPFALIGLDSETRPGKILWHPFEARVVREHEQGG